MKTLLAASLLASSVLSPADSAAEQSGSAAATISGTWQSRLSDSWTRREGERWVSVELAARRQAQLRHLLPAVGARGGGHPGRAVLGQRRALRAPPRRRNDSSSKAPSIPAAAAARSGSRRTRRSWPRCRRRAGRSPADDALRLAIHDVSETFIASIEQAGYKGVDVEDLIKMRIHGVDADYITGLRKAGYDKLSVEDLIKTRIHGATPAYVMELRNAGYTEPVDRRRGQDPHPRRHAGIRAGSEGCGLRRRRASTIS